MGEIDNPHDAEKERQPARDQGVVAAEQDTLDDLVDPDHGVAADPASPK